MDEQIIRQGEILQQLATVIKLSEESRNEIKLLRTELGAGDTTHGRLPVAEAQLVRLEMRIDKMDQEVDGLKHGVSETVGKHKFTTSVLAMLSGGGVVGLIELAKVLLK